MINVNTLSDILHDKYRQQNLTVVHSLFAYEIEASTVAFSSHYLPENRIAFDWTRWAPSMNSSTDLFFHLSSLVDNKRSPWRFLFQLASLTSQRGFHVMLFDRVIRSLISPFVIVATTRRPVTAITSHAIKLNWLSSAIVAQEIMAWCVLLPLQQSDVWARAAENVQLCFGHIKSLRHPSQGAVKRHECRKQEHLRNGGRRSSAQPPPLGEVMRRKRHTLSNPNTAAVPTSTRLSASS